ncbi:MAG: hypothetical protein E6Q43_05095 [Dokdonella sp.]|nr:MAG: hypothetical protein E6Q43_05095 [Dokdonella sp.]
MTRLSCPKPLLIGVLCLGISIPCMAQKTQIKGNTEINASSNNTTAVAIGSNVTAKNRVGVVQGEKKGNTKINVATGNVTTVVAGRNKKACTNIGAIVSDDCK